jgi:tRNA (guanine-N7-)-methyltransferase
MRMRLKKYLTERVEAARDYIVVGYDLDKDARNDSPLDVLDLAQVFGNDNPVCLEVGCGKGQWICRMAVSHPDVNYLAVEKYTNVIIPGVERAKRENLTNLRFGNCGVEYLPRHIVKHAFDKIYLNFSSPFPTASHEKQRLTYKRFLSLYKEWLKEGGQVVQKTDNRHFFEYSLQSMSEAGMVFDRISLDLHQDPIPNLTSEYEDRFAPLGPIYYLEAHFPSQN